MGGRGNGSRPLHPVHRGRRRARGARSARARTARSRRRLADRRRSGGRARTAAGAPAWRSECPRTTRRVRVRARGGAAAGRARLGPALGRAPGRARAPGTAPARPDRAGRPARRRSSLHGARLPSGDARRRRHPPRRLCAGAVALSSRATPRGCRPTRTAPASTGGRAAVGVDPVGAGPLRMDFLCEPTPAARLRAFCRRTGFPAVLPEWGYGFWKSRDVYEHQDDVLDDFDGCAATDTARRDRARLTLGDAIQHVGVQPPPVPRRPGDDPAMRERRGQDRGVGHAVGEPRLPRRQVPPPSPSVSAEMAGGSPSPSRPSVAGSSSL